MDIFSRDRQQAQAAPELTPDAVAAVLAATGYQVADREATEAARTEGFFAYTVPVTHEDRVGVSWNIDIFGDYDDPRAAAAGWLTAMATTLARAGYQSEFVCEMVSDYLVVWVEGEF